MEKDANPMPCPRAIRVVYTPLVLLKDYPHEAVAFPTVNVVSQSVVIVLAINNITNGYKKFTVF
jgi:hypothetical protein